MDPAPYDAEIHLLTGFASDLRRLEYDFEMGYRERDALEGSLNRRLASVQRAVKHTGVNYVGEFKGDLFHDFLENATHPKTRKKVLEIVERAVGVFQNDLVPEDLKLREEEAARKREEEERTPQPRRTQPWPLPDARAAALSPLDSLFSAPPAPPAELREELDVMIARNNAARVAFGYEKVAMRDAVPPNLPPASESEPVPEPRVEAAARDAGEPPVNADEDRGEEPAMTPQVSGNVSELGGRRVTWKRGVTVAGVVLLAIGNGYLQKWGEILRTSNVDRTVLFYFVAALGYVFRWMFWPAVFAGAAYWFALRKIRAERAITMELLRAMADAGDDRDRKFREDIEKLRASHGPSAAAMAEALRRKVGPGK